MTKAEYTNFSLQLLKMWVDDVLTDGEYNKIMDRMNGRYLREHPEAVSELRENH